MITFVLTLLFISLLIIAHEFGHLIVAKLFKIHVQKFSIGFPPCIWSKKIGGTEYSINAILFGGFVKLSGETQDASYNLTDDERKQSFSAQPFWKKAAVVVGGVAMNFIAGWFIFSFLFFWGIPQRVGISEVLPGSPAEAAGINAYDIVLEIKTPDGTIKPRDIEDFGGIMTRYANSPLIISVQRQGGNSKIEEIAVTPRVSGPDEGALGVRVIAMGIQKKPFFESIRDGLQTAAGITYGTFRGIIGLFINIFTGKGPAGVGGPVAIFNMAIGAQELGFTYFLFLIGTISLSLAAFNIFPFPVLDGGRLLFLLIEKLKGSALSPRSEQIANGIGATLLIALMVFVTVKDVMGIF